MSSIAIIVVALIALLHVFFLAHEMLLWDKPAGLHSFRQTQPDWELLILGCLINLQAGIGIHDLQMYRQKSQVCRPTDRKSVV